MAQVAEERVPGGRMLIPRSRGAASGFLLILLGLWGLLVPFLGPAFGFAYNPDQGAAWTAARGWLEVLPGLVAIIGGLLLLRTRNRATAMLGGWLGVLAGAWYVVGRVVATTLTIGEIGAPVANTDAKAAWLELTYFYGLGAVLIFLAAIALGRLSVRTERDISYAQRSAVATHDRHADPIDDSTVVSEPATGVTTDEQARPCWRNRLGRHRDTPTTVA